MSGQIALDPATGELVQDSIEAETYQVMKNIKAILTDAGLTFDQFVFKNCYRLFAFLLFVGEYDVESPILSWDQQYNGREKMLWWFAGVRDYDSASPNLRPRVAKDADALRRVVDDFVVAGLPEQKVKDIVQFLLPKSNCL